MSVLDCANQAVFQRQLKTEQAVRFIMKLTGTDEQTARRAVQSTVTWYRN